MNINKFYFKWPKKIASFYQDGSFHQGGDWIDVWGISTLNYFNFDYYNGSGTISNFSK